VEDVCYERRQAEACVDYSDHREESIDNQRVTVGTSQVRGIFSRTRYKLYTLWVALSKT
jgi:hypothetical protein